MKIMELNTKEYEELVKKELAEEKKKMPEKLPNKFHYTGEEELANKINEIIDYLKSKGE